jgi:hypothetical protein
VEWQWTLGQIVTTLVAAGMQILHLGKYLSPFGGRGRSSSMRLGWPPTERGRCVLAVGADAIDCIRAALGSRPAALGKSAQRGRLAQQH